VEKTTPEYCIVATADGKRRKMRAPEWWVNARDPRVEYPEGYVPEYADRPPWTLNTKGRRLVFRGMQSVADSLKTPEGQATNILDLLSASFDDETDREFIAEWMVVLSRSED